MNIAYNADCMEALKEYPDKYFDLATEQLCSTRKRNRSAQNRIGKDLF